MRNEFIVKQFINEDKSISSFRSGIRSAIRGLWNGSFSKFEFVDSMRAAIERGYREAWIEGAAECGITFDELTKKELNKLKGMTNAQFPFLPGFASDISEKSKADGYLLQPHLDRGEMWVSQYGVVKNTAIGLACANKKKEWVLGDAEHCNSCLKLSGKVKRMSFWVERGILPQVNNASYLECHGYKCACELRDTDKPISRGPLPSLP